MTNPTDLIYIQLFYVSKKKKKGYYLLLSINEPLSDYKIEISRKMALELTEKYDLQIRVLETPLEAKKLKRYIDLSDNKKKPKSIQRKGIDHIEGYLGLYYSVKDQSHFVHILIPEPETKIYFEIREAHVHHLSQDCSIDIHRETEETLRPLAS